MLASLRRAVRVPRAAMGLVAVGSMLLGFAWEAAAVPVRVLGIDTGRSWQYSTVPFLSDVIFTKVSTEQFATVNLHAYDILFVSDNPFQPTLDALKARESDLAAWLSGKHGLLALAETGPSASFSSLYDWLPDAAQPALASFSSNSVEIVQPGHPVMAGLTNGGLSGWNASVHGYFSVPADFSVLAKASCTTCLNPLPITLAGTYGLGRLVLTTQDPDEHHARGVTKEDQVRLVQNALSWVAQPILVPEPDCGLLLGLGVLGLVVWRARQV